MTQRGRVKRLPLREFTNISGRGLVAIKLKPDDALAFVRLAEAGKQLVLATSNGRLLRFAIDDEQLPMMSRTAQGLSAIRVGQKERLVGTAVVSDTDSVLIVTAQGYAKRLSVGMMRLVNRGGIGTQMLRFSSKTDGLIGLVRAPEESSVILQTNTNQTCKLETDSVDFWGKDGTGDPVLSLDSGETLIDLTCILTAGDPEEEVETSD